MTSVESDFADHPGDGPPGGFIIWLIPILWPMLIIRLILAIPERRPSQFPSGPMAGPSRVSARQNPRPDSEFHPYDPFPQGA